MSIAGVLKKQKWIWLSVVAGIILVRLAAADRPGIESYYATGFYVYFSILLRFLFGWVPFSVGDILYLVAGAWVCWKLARNTGKVFTKKLTRDVFIKKTGAALMAVGAVYIVFNVFWGLNYNRRGITWQLRLPGGSYDTASVLHLQQMLLEKVNDTKSRLVRDQALYPDNHGMFLRARQCYDQAAHVFPFLQYRGQSVKSSMYGLLGDYLGFTGYYNPFTGEAQVNTTVPRFLIPYITLHEMAHQLGYAKENEANFVGYLAAANSTDTLFQYSAYLDLFIYANREVYYFDTTAAHTAAEQLSPAVRQDILEWRNFNRKYRSRIEPLISWLYGKFLQANLQPKGLQSYDEVVAALISYYKKSGHL